MSMKKSEVDSHVALPVGYELHQRYVIEKILGQGGFGITYRAKDETNKRQVAVKELFPTRSVIRSEDGITVKVLSGKEADFTHMKKRFLEEARRLNAFQDSPDIVSVYHLLEANHTAYYVMEYLTGMDLNHYMKQHGKLNWNHLSVFVRMAIHALQTLHSRNLIHRDISPDNLFITESGRLVLIDFGSVRSCDANNFTTFLKHSFAPLEQYRENGHQGPWTDIYALCVTMYYALSGVLPPQAPMRVETKEIPIEQLCPGLPEHVAQAIRKGMEIQPEKRFQNVKELEQALFPNTVSGPVPEELEPTKPPLTPPPTPTPTIPKKYLACVGGAYKGRSIQLPVGVGVTIGRSADCQIAYPANAAGISRRQCTLFFDRQGSVYIRDEDSAYGTYLNQTRLAPGRWYPVKKGVYIAFGQEVYQLM